ncbi:MAG: elongation factor G [Bacillota bacterium]
MANLKNIRNVCFISHGGAGKTTLTEMTLFNAGEIKEPGSIEKGNTKSDFIPEEKDHLYSINNSYFTFNWNNREVNLIDTPGYADFKGEVVSALNMVEGAVLLLNGTAGIEVNTNYVWNKAVENDLARLVFINKLDDEGAKFAEVYEELKEEFDDKFVILNIPHYEDGEYKGVINFLTKEFINVDGESKEITDEMYEKVEDYRVEFMEKVVEEDDELMMKYLEGEDIDNKEMIKVLKKSVEERKMVPVLSGSALKNSGIKLLLNDIVDMVPSPVSKESIYGKDRDGNEIEIEKSEDGDLVGFVGKTMVDPYIGKLSIFRILSGTLDRNSEVLIPRSNEKFSTTKFYKLNGSEQKEVDKLTAGEIGAVAKIDELETSDTICSSSLDFVLPEIEFPKPMLIQAAIPDGDEEKLSSALNRYKLEDPTFKVEYNKETKEMLIKGMGTIHLSVINDMCKRKFDVGFKTKTPKVSYKETIQKKVKVEEKYKKQSGGRGQYGHVMLRIEPLARGKGFEFDEEIFGGAIPKQYIPGVEKGVKEAMEEGVLAHYPVVDIKAVVYDGSYHDVDSSEMAFKIAASKAFRQGMEKAKPVLLEPIMKVQVTVPESFMGDIMGDLNSRRGRILGMDPQNGYQIINAEVPQAEMFSYATDLKSITGGYGNFDMEFSHFAKVPNQEAEEIIENRKKEE